MPLINYEINLILLGLKISTFTGPAIFAIANTKMYIPLVTLETQHNTRLLQQLNKTAFKKN